VGGESWGVVTTPSLPEATTLPLAEAANGEPVAKYRY
jgi:hypothetical protein